MLDGYISLWIPHRIIFQKSRHFCCCFGSDAGKKTDTAAEVSDEKTSLHSIKIKCDGHEDGKVTGDVTRDANESDDSTEAEDGPGSMGKQRKISRFYCMLSG